MIRPKRPHDDDQCTADGPCRRAPWVFIAYPGYHMNPACKSQGVYLLYLEQHSIPGFQPGSMSSIARSGPVPPTVAASPLRVAIARFPAIAISFSPSCARRVRVLLWDTVLLRPWSSIALLATLAGAPTEPMDRRSEACISCRRAATISWVPMEPEWTSSAGCCSRPRIDLAIAIVGTLVSATIGGGVGALVGLL